MIGLRNTTVRTSTAARAIRLGVIDALLAGSRSKRHSRRITHVFRTLTSMQRRIEAGIYPLSAGFLPGLPGSFLVGLWVFRRLLSGPADQGRLGVGGGRAARGQGAAGGATRPPRPRHAPRGPP